MSLIVARTEDVAACSALRRTVFIEEQGVSEADEMDGRDGEAVHLLARLDGTAIGSARLLLDPPAGKIGRVCVLGPHRGTGAGVALVEAAIGVLRGTDGIDRARLGAQIHALDFYRRFGFEAEGPIYDDAGIPHRDMVLSLAPAR